MVSLKFINVNIEMLEMYESAKYLTIANRLSSKEKFQQTRDNLTS